jgi:hypothetical protein
MIEEERLIAEEQAKIDAIDLKDPAVGAAALKIQSS